MRIRPGRSATAASPRFSPARAFRSHAGPWRNIAKRWDWRHRMNADESTESDIQGVQAMQLSVTGHHIEITPALRGYVEKKLGRIVRHFDHVIDSHFVLTVEKLLH